MRHVVSVSSGAGSAYTWHLVMAEHGRDETVGLFADVNGEHEDNYRFLGDIHAAIGGRLEVLGNDGRTIWDVFRKGRFLANTRVDSCSRALKREPIKAWLEANCDPDETIVYLGIDWTEAHRYERAKARWAADGWTVQAPMVDRCFDKGHALEWLASVGIKPPLLTTLGFAHANCGGGCVKAGAAQFRHLLRVLPESFAEWEANEAKMRELLGDVAILRDRIGGDTKPMPLSELRRRVEAEPTLFDDAEWGGCGCFTDVPT